MNPFVGTGCRPKLKPPQPAPDLTKGKMNFSNPNAAGDRGNA
jgi:hypothetical protein